MSGKRGLRAVAVAGVLMLAGCSHSAARDAAAPTGGVVGGTAGVTGSPAPSPPATSPGPNDPVAPLPSTGPASLPATLPSTVPGPPGTVPATATVLNAQLTVGSRGVVTDKNIYGPVQIIDAALVARVAGVVNAAPLDTIGPKSCPPPVESGQMEIVFRAVAYGPALATVDISDSSCAGIEIGTGPTHVLRDGGSDTVNRIIAILGLDWPAQHG